VIDMKLLSLKTQFSKASQFLLSGPFRARLEAANALPANVAAPAPAPGFSAGDPAAIRAAARRAVIDETTNAARATTPASGVATLTKQAQILVAQGTGFDVQCQCPRGHRFVLTSKNQDGPLTFCEECHSGYRLKDCALSNVPASSTPAAPAPRRPATSPAPQSAASSPAPTVIYASAPGKKYYQSVNGRCVEVHPDLAEAIGKAAGLGAEWQQAFGKNPDSATAFSRAFTGQYREKLEATQARLGLKND
jgi:hypothetical protein